MSHESTIEAITSTTRAHELGAELRLLRIRSDMRGTANTIHALRNGIATVQGALELADIYGKQGHQGNVEAMLQLAETRLREIRRLLFGSQRTRSMRRAQAVPTVC
jgi:hypothetical protein